LLWRHFRMRAGFGRANYDFGLYTAALMQDMTLTTNHPKGSRLRVITQVMTKPMQAMTNQSRADKIRPCTSCPRPGMNKLQIAAMTLPVEP
jgi:hypothetical protein